MPTPITIVKMRTMLGRLAAHGIEASRATRSDESRHGSDALLIAEDGRAWLVAIWSGSTLQPSLLAADDDTQSLDIFAARLVDQHRQMQAIAGDPAPDLMILAPLLPAEEIAGGIWRIGTEIIPIVTQRDCKKATTLARAILSHISPVLPQEAISRWRVAAVPEVRIESPWKRKAITRAATALAAPLLLDYKQERCARLDLEREPDAENLAKDLQLRVVTGVAGCGKTLVLVHRAALLATHFPNARVLLISFNRPLINDLKRRLARHHASGRIECLTFNQWLGKVAPTGGDMMSTAEVIRWIERERTALTSLTKLSTEWLRDELNWMCDHALATEAYLTAERKGRGTRLSPKQRRELLHLLTRYRAHLRVSKRTDWSDWPLSVRDNPPPSLAREQFDHLLIDEAQFFAPVWLELLRGALKPGGHLFLCADPTQGFLKRRMSWAALGFDVRTRRPHRLEKPYRSTRAILQFARDFYQSRLPADEEPLNLPAPEWLETLDSGTAPILQPGGPGQDQLARLVIEIRHLRAHDTPSGHILILVAGRTFTVENIRHHLNAQLGSHSASSMKDDHAPPDSIGIAHLMAATGLERPIVFLLGVDDLIAEECNPTLSEEERAEKHHMHIRQIYVGLTRAMERLVIYSDRCFDWQSIPAQALRHA
ncbi:MAG: UvrD-helicase domain-containing protein [Prosthecobacter sp.]